MTAIDVEVQVGTTPDLEADVQIAPPTFTVVSVLPTGPRGPVGEGVPTGGTDGQVLTKTSATDFATAWEDATGGGGGGAPTTADYLVGTAQAGLSTEIVVGTAPAGELGGTWASPTVDATHSGSSHAGVQAAAEATAAADATAKVAAEAALARSADNLTSGTVADARVAATIARDSEVATAVSDHAGAADPHGDRAAAVALVDDLSGVTNAATARTNLGLGTAATQASGAFDAAGAAAAAQAASQPLAAVLTATTASFLTADESKLDGIEAGADVTDAANVAAAGAVMDTGDETVAGVKTFSSDPIIPDEVYGVGWNTSLEPPTKNAVYDKIETLGGGGTVDVVSNVATARILGRTTAGSGDSEELTAADTKTLLGLVVGTDVQAFSSVLAATTASFLTADETKLDAIEAGATADQTAAEILAALLTVDGAASGLDADLLDGQSSAAFATAAALTAHIDDAADAHDASAVSVVSTTLVGTGTDVQAVLEELDNAIVVDETALANHLSDTSAAHAASAVSVDSTTLVGTGTDAQAVFEELDNGIADHLADTTAAHAASAIAFTPTGTIAATDVQAAIAEVASEAGGGGATKRILLPVGGGVAPDGSGSGNNPAALDKVVSSGTQATNSPKASYYRLLFDPTTDEHWMWSFVLPGDYASGGTLRGHFTNVGVSANGVTWKGAAAIAVAGTTDLDAIVFDTVVTANATPDTNTGDPVEFTIALTMTNAAANRDIIVMVGRDPDNASDTNASDMALVGLTFEYVAA